MFDFERLTRSQHIGLALAGVAAALAIFAADVFLGLGLVAPLFYVALLLAYHTARIERVYLLMGAVSGTLTLGAGYLALGTTLTLIEALDRLVFVAVLTALAVVLSRGLAYQRQLRAQSAIDEVTGITQQAAFIEMITKEALRAKRYHNPCTLAVFEIDDLRQLTVNHGRATRDRLLRALAKSCADGLRPTDMLGRIDDRVVAGLPETREIDAAVVAERLRRATFDIEAAQEGGGAVQFRVTCGIAAFTEDDELPDVMEHAEGALREAQAAGGNRVSIAPEDVPAIA